MGADNDHGFDARQRQRKDIQTVICSKERFKSAAAARAWARENEFRTDKIDENDESYRFRQFDPGQCKDGSQRTIEITSGVKAVICAKRGATALELPILYREHAMDARRLHEDEEDEEEEGKRFDVSVSSEAEIERSMFGMSTFVEILSHAPEAIDMSRLKNGAPVLMEHDVREQIGVVEKAYIEDRTLRAVIRFSRNPRGREVERDVEDGIRRNLSVGYLPRKMKLEEDSEGKKKYRITRWQPGEISVVSIPADITVGIGRAASGEFYPVEVEPAEEERVMGNEVKPGAAGIETPDKGKELSPEVQSRLEASEIQRVCDANKMSHRAEEFIKAGYNLDKVSAIILAERKGEAKPAGARPAEAPDKPVDAVEGLPERDRKRYSYVRAIQLAAGIREGKGTDTKSLEWEVHEHLFKNKAQGYQVRGGIMVPMDLRTVDQAWRDREMQAKRALDTKTLTKGAEVVFDVPGEFIELLRARTAVIALGAQSLSGLTGPVAFPKQTSAMTGYWVGENPASAVTASDIGLGLIVLTPKTLQGTTSYSRQLLGQVSVDIENLVRNDFANVHALAIDKAAIHGKGTDGQPTGVYKAADVNSKAMGGVPDFVKLIDMITQVHLDNALAGTLGWLTTPEMAGKLRSTPEHSTATVAGWIWQGTVSEGTLAGYRGISTAQVSSLMSGSDDTGGTEHGIVFGNWADCVVGMFGSFEIVVDPYTLAKKGMIEVTSFQMTDLILRHGQSFTKATGATLS